ncbi:hypothetical protein HM003_08380 [Candidatus Bathyarchaeota archaeon A05DMB-5]|jgi:CRISPR/Cas system CSM-associated protein Csm3 (group 7 of RAMP superfamily)|nr:hypothetical protein [Candidatus Bathyarchaeota archaeon A05DMB-5]
MRKWEKLEIELVTKAPFRIGGVKPIPGTTDVDSPVVKLGNKIVVQGTSLKGALRHELETYLIDNFLDKTTKRWKNPWLKPCIPADERTISADERKLLENGFYKFCCSYPNPNDYICPVCYLLGARGLIGFVNVPFLNMTKGSVEPLQFIREDRVIGTSARGERGAIGKFEAIPEDSIFKGVVTILVEDDILGWKIGQKRNLTESQGDKWLDSAEWTKDKVENDLIKNRLANIKDLGGYRSKGFGQVDIKIKPMA